MFIKRASICFQKSPLDCSKRCLSTKVYDVVVSGGGMVGAATTAALGTNSSLKNKKVLFLESSSRNKYTPTEKYSNRVSAISPASKRLLEGVGAWSKICAGRMQPVKYMYVWESCSDAFIDFTQKDSEGHLAYLVENDLTVAALTDVIHSCPSVDVMYETSVLKYEFPSDSGGLVDVHLSNDSKINARFVVGADGFKSLVRTSSNINTCSWNYDQVGVVATLSVEVQGEANDTAWQRFLPTGPIALLPLSDKLSSLVWSTVPDHGKYLLSLSPDAFVKEVNKALTDDYHKNSILESIISQYSRLLQQVIAEGKKRDIPKITDLDGNSRAMFPYGFMHADRYVAPRVALVGDACHRIHPLAGQGVNLGFGDVECLIGKLSEALQHGSDIGDVEHLKDYETERQRHVLAISAGVDGLYRLYSNTLTPLVLLRSLGLITVNSLNPLKKIFMQYAQT